MKKGLLFAFALVASLAFAFPAFGQDIDRITQLERDQATLLTAVNGIASTQTRMKADNENTAARVTSVENKLDALAKRLFPNEKFSPSTVNEWGDGRSASFTSTPAAASWGAAAPMMTYSAGAGACAGGQCGSGQGLIRRVLRR